jgi:hypothetical protein
MFPGTHGRQGMLVSSAPKALRLGDLPAGGALWWVTTGAVAILIAVFVLHRHVRSHHLRSAFGSKLLPNGSIRCRRRVLDAVVWAEAEGCMSFVADEGNVSSLSTR